MGPGLTPLRFMLRLLRSIKAPDLEATLLLLPFTHATMLLRILVKVVASHSVTNAAHSLSHSLSVCGLSWCEGATRWSCVRAVRCF